MTEMTDLNTSPMKQPFLVRRRTVFTWIGPLLLLAAALYFHTRYGGWPVYVSGIILVVFGEAVRFWAAGYIAKDAEITTGGPYAHVRNPLYFGSLLLAFGYSMVSGLGWGGVIAMVGAFLVFHLAAIIYEEQFLTKKFGTAYTDYTQKVPRLLPSPVPRTSGEGHFAWSQAINNREHISALFAVLFTGLLSLHLIIK